MRWFWSFCHQHKSFGHSFCTRMVFLLQYKPHHAKKGLSPGRPVSRKRVSKFPCPRPRCAITQRCIASYSDRKFTHSTPVSCMPLKSWVQGQHLSPYLIKIRSTIAKLCSFEFNVFAPILLENARPCRLPPYDPAIVISSVSARFCSGG